MIIFQISKALTFLSLLVNVWLFLVKIRSIWTKLFYQHSAFCVNLWSFYSGFSLFPSELEKIMEEKRKKKWNIILGKLIHVKKRYILFKTVCFSRTFEFWHNRKLKIVRYSNFFEHTRVVWFSNCLSEKVWFILK